jgi:hypothetical protein
VERCLASSFAKRSMGGGPSACLRLRMKAGQLQVFWACDKDKKPDFAPSFETPGGYVGQAAI